MSEAIVGQRRGVRAWAAALVLLCAASLWVTFRHIDSTLPYPGNADEGAVSEPAARLLMTGSLNPVTYNYPSLSKYLAAAGLAAGFLRSASHLETRDIHDLGNVGYPYYDLPRAVAGGRQMFALLAAIALAATGVAAWHAFHRPSAILLAPLALATTPLFFEHAWTYMNVDVAGLCFATLTLAACLQGTRQPSLVRSAIIPGVYAGLATGSKYTLMVTVLPVLLGIALYLRPGRRMWAGLAALAVLGVTFALVAPLGVIDLPRFLSGVAWEAFHYARGHVGAEADPGWPQMIFYGRHLLSEYGVTGTMVAILGLGAFTLADWRRAAILLAFPFSLLASLVSERTHFVRNVLSVQAVIAMFLAYGLIVVHGWVVRQATRRGGAVFSTMRLRVVTAFVLVGAIVPWWRVPGYLRDRTDSRNLAVAWMETRVPQEWTVVVPKQLRFDARPLQARGLRIVEVDPQSAPTQEAFQRVLGGMQGPGVLFVPTWGADARFEGQAIADALNGLSQQLQVVKTFGTKPVLVNYAEPVPEGDPKFGIAVLGRHALQP
jgi:hypothetical protein